MKGALLIGAIILFIIVFYNVCNDAIEEFRGRGGGRWRWVQKRRV
jgi:hypothetical protein